MSNLCKFKNSAENNNCQVWNHSLFATLTHDQPNAPEISILTIAVFVPVNPDDLLVICQHLVWCELLFDSLNSRNFSPVLVLEVELSDDTIDIASDLFDLFVQDNCLETICILVFGQEDGGSNTVGVDHLQRTNPISIFITWFPAKFDGLNGLVFWHGTEICIGGEPEVDSKFSSPEFR